MGKKPIKGGPAAKAKKITIAKQAQLASKSGKPAVALKKKKSAAKSPVAHVATMRTPIVAVMGHVDHGKTSLIDAIRGTRVQAGEAGGITQNTRAHKVTLAAGTPSEITFIDTPGHQAFSQMRARGARVADIAMLVVAADDGVQPQTKESIEFILKSGLPVIVASNKMDLPGANPDKVKQELSQHKLLVEEYGGDAVFIPVSAVKGDGVQDLLEAVQLLAQVHDMKTNLPAQGQADGFVLEANTDRNLGSVALLIVKSGTIQKGQYLVAGGRVHKIRATLDENQKQTAKGVQGDPCWIIGLEEVLEVGQNVVAFESQVEAEKLVEAMKAAAEPEAVAEAASTEALDILAGLISKKAEIAHSETKLNVIVKADSQGTLEAILAQLAQLSFADARVVPFMAQTGNISESDVEMARDTKSIVLGFQVKIDPKAELLARNERILVRVYQIIYDLVNEVEAVVQSMLAPEEEIVEVARAKVKQVFQLSDGKYVAGSEVTSGNVIRGYRAYVERDGEEVAEGKIVSLKQLKSDVKEIRKGQDCGIIMEPQFAIQPGDQIVCFKIEK